MGQVVGGNRSKVETRRFQIVVAEDNHADVMLVKEALKIHGVYCEIVVISDGAEAVRYFRGLDLNFHSPIPDLVLLDMHLPKCDGEDILRALRSRECIAQPPVLIMTSSTASEIEKVAQKHAALHYFKKPSSWVEFAELGAIVRNLLEGPNSDRSQTAPSGSTAEEVG
jgi:DNA-binding response OmpR family regulator